MDYSSMSHALHGDSMGLKLESEYGDMDSYESPLNNDSDMKLFGGCKIEADFEPQTRARSNTWPQPRPEEGQPIVCPPTLPENELLPNGPQNGNLVSYPKKSTSRRNAWGNLSYADLITQAIHSSPEKRLTLSQIYDWMVTNVSYFKDKGDSNSSAGWKNSIRHNLSLHNRFMRVQNEGTGKSSWWMLNPDAKPGKAARRRATSMETSKFEKKRGRIKKKLEAIRNGGILDTPSPASSLSEGLDLFPESPHHVHSFNLSPSDFRTRANSNASSCGGRLSPILGEVSGLDESGGWAEFSYSPYPSDRFGTEQLAQGLANTVKLNENNGRAHHYEFHPHSFPSPHNESVYGSSYSSGSSYLLPSSSSAPTISQQQMGEVHRVKMSSNAPPPPPQSSVQINQPPPELDFSLDLDTNPFECNVDEVLRTELNLGEGIDFNFPPPPPPHPPHSSSQLHSSSQQPLNNHFHQNLTSAQTSNPPYPSVHHHQQQSQWTSVLH